MDNALTETEKKIVAAIQGDMPIVARPYAVLAQGAGITEAQFLACLKDLCDRGVVRRFGATIRHQASGFRANAMVAWQVDPKKADAVGEAFAGFSGVSHCYRRPTAPDWPYNLYTMLHAHDMDACQALAAQLAEKAGVDTYKLLFSKRELKKTSMEYFPKDKDEEAP